ncbi:MAG: hypothetical protein C5B50_12220 [Verrucomicrobia bacterium]|nr:MAG: hypothetical protein C5B50_12220 [Verrucomicrobiota bacterium]
MSLLQTPVTAWLRSMTVLEVMLSAPSEPSLGMASWANSDAGGIAMISATSALIGLLGFIIFLVCQFDVANDQFPPQRALSNRAERGAGLSFRALK